LSLSVFYAYAYAYAYAYVTVLVFFAFTLLSNSNNRLAIGESLALVSSAFGCACHLLEDDARRRAPTTR
jgi:hypothetical protein